jgi:hypothetical protein
MERPRSKFDRSHQLLTTINEGELVPIYYDEVLPGDTAKVHLNGLIRMSTPIYPVMDNCYMDTYFFFVPCRLLWEHWENMFGENDTNYWAEKTEYSTPTCTIGGKSGLKNGSLGDYFGLPTGVKNGIKVNALPGLSRPTYRKGTRGSACRCVHLLQKCAAVRCSCVGLQC